MLFELLRAHGIEPVSAVLIQDANMQRRPGAIARLREPGVRAINYAVPRARHRGGTGALRREARGHGTWAAIVALLMGEVPRLRDDAKKAARAAPGSSPTWTCPTRWSMPGSCCVRPIPGDVRAANPAYADRG